MASEKYTRALSWNVHTVNHLWLEDSFEKWERQCEGRVSYLHFVPALDDIVGDLIVSDARDLDFKSKAEFFAIKTNDNEKELPIFSDVRDVVLKSKPENVEIQSNDIQMELPIFDVSDTRDGALKNKTELVEIQSKDELPVQDDLPIFIKETISKDDGNKDTNMQSEMISPVSNIKTEPIIKESNKADRKESKRSKKAVEPQAIKKLREKTIIINQEVKAEVNLKVKEIKEAERTSPINETLPVNRKRASSVQEADPKKQKIISESVNQLKTQISDSQVDQLEETPTIKPTTRSKSMLNSNIIVVLTGCRLTEKQQEALKTIGISLTDDIKQATHLVADRIKRTEKMLNAIRENLVINSFEWLIDCISKKKIVVDKILRDTEHEELFGMTLESSLANSSRNPKPLQGISVFIDGKSAVDQVLKRLVVKAGGTLKKGGIVADTEVLLNCFLRWEFDDLL